MGQLLDKLYLIASKEMDSKHADKLVRDLIKIIIKLGILYRNNRFNDEELLIGENMRKRLRKIALTVISFHEVDFTYDQAFLSKDVVDLGGELHKIVARHLTTKSHNRIDNFIGFFSNGAMLDKVFLPGGQYHGDLQNISQSFSSAVEKEW